MVIAAIGSSASALDAFNRIAKARPEALDLSSGVSSRGGFFSVFYDLETECPPLNQIHSWELALVDREGNPLDGADVTIVADMPEHLHGMTTQPQVSDQSSPGHFRVDGMNFHMPGWWVVTLDVSRNRGRDLAYFNVVVGEGFCHSQ
ncbi:MAG: FixH family protein [Pseudomonadota bacterium]